jgi:hypothetical protein
LDGDVVSRPLIIKISEHSHRNDKRPDNCYCEWFHQGILQFEFFRPLHLIPVMRDPTGRPGDEVAPSTPMVRTRRMIRDWHPACRLKPASSAVPATSAKEENKKNNDYNRLGIHDVKPFQYDGFGLGFSTISAFARMPSPSLGTSSGEMPRPGRHSLIARSKQLARTYSQ